jgi:DNA polymerase III delta prime subunit
MTPRKEEFLREITSAIGRLFPIAETDSALFNAQEYTAMLRGAELWLSPRHVEHFHIDDFSELAPSDQQKLNAEVGAFRAIAATVPQKGPATQEQSEAGRRHLVAIYALLKPTLDEYWKHGEVA